MNDKTTTESATTEIEEREKKSWRRQDVLNGRY